MENPEAEALPDLERETITVRSIEAIKVGDQTYIEASIELTDPNGHIQKIHDQIAKIKIGGSYEVFEDYDELEIREAIEQYLSQHPDALKKTD